MFIYYFCAGRIRTDINWTVSLFPFSVTVFAKVASAEDAIMSCGG